jgi:pyridoxine kinase
MLKRLPPPRIAAIHDLSCFGRCALTVIMPALSVMGYQVVPIPTAFLSTHTGGFTDLHFRDLTADMEATSDHFARLGIGFRAIYTGFLGSAEQIQTVSAIIERFGNKPDESGKCPLILVDPVMGDDGELYSTYTPELMRGMRALCRHAQLLTPNLTEACFLTDTPYRDTLAMNPDEAIAFAGTLLQKLKSVTDGRIVITGISLSDGRLANMGLDENGTSFTVITPHETQHYPGTGDLFASVLLGNLLSDAPFPAAVSKAAEFVGKVMHDSATIDTPTRDGVALEYHLGDLISK